mmetsp:Transcript_8131/g.20345  ORF Transcript_8131/g.20345 Transcript_8131/m.20345 type:complete len:502 (-) Transcript_8131:105-1610(-)
MAQAAAAISVARKRAARLSMFVGRQSSRWIPCERLHARLALRQYHRFTAGPRMAWRACQHRPWCSHVTRANAAATAIGGVRVGCWNQHRVGSYLQQNCPWVSRLRALGASRAEVQELISTIRVEYEAPSVHAWLDACDVAALQEVDDALRQVLLDVPGGGVLLESGPHVDGRGQQVDCTVAIFLPTRAGFHVVREARAELRVRLPGGRGEAVRDHVAALLRRVPVGGGVGDSEELLALCPVHLHPPASIRDGGAQYLSYLEPLKRLLSDLVPESVPCAVVGDFNTTPANFLERVAEDPFWASFSVLTCPEGITAHRSNPSEVGDFGIFRSSRHEGICEAIGSSDFASFERFADEIVANAVARLPLLRTRAELGRASESLGRALTGLTANVVGSPAVQPAPPSRRPPPPPLISGGGGLACMGGREAHRPPPPPPRFSAPRLVGFLEGAIAELDAHQQHLEKAKSAHERTLAKGLLTSDHRPLLFQWVTSEAAVVEDGRGSSF